VVVRKKISNMKAISAVEVALTPGMVLFFLAILLNSFNPTIFIYLLKIPLKFTIVAMLAVATKK
jgi:hypothetical protein